MHPENQFYKMAFQPEILFSIKFVFLKIYFLFHHRELVKSKGSPSLSPEVICQASRLLVFLLLFALFILRERKGQVVFR